MKKANGAITIITLVTILFMLAFLISTYTIISNRRQAQEEIKSETKDIYEQNIDNIEQIYGEYFAAQSAEIPIYNIEQLFKVASNEYVVINDIIYKFTPSANYVLMNDIDFEVDNYYTQDKYKNIFASTQITVITQQATSEEVKLSPYSGNEDSYQATVGGTYKLEVWGANGGTYNSKYAVGGTGGYSVGNLRLEENDNIYIYVGGAGTVGTSASNAEKNGGGYNGGGNAATKGGAGGGATDIRILGNTLYNRLIVAGGGGGTDAYSTYISANGGNGGGIIGNDGSYNSTYTAYAGKGGTQTLGGEGGTSSGNYNGESGTFGIGGNSGNSLSATLVYSNGAGGGGWYGGGGAANAASALTGTPGAGGGGGSGFVLTASTIDSTPTGYLITDEKYYLTEAGTYSATDSEFIANPVTNGNGYAKITLISKDVETTSNAIRWINIEKQIENGTLTGTFTYNQCKITETDSESNVVIHDGTN